MFKLPPHRLITAMAVVATFAVPSALFAQTEQASVKPPATTTTTTITESPDRALLATFTKVDRDEIQMARAALPGLKDAEVKGYAQKMIDDHTAHLTATTNIASRLQVPQPPDSTVTLKPATTRGTMTTGTTTPATTTVSTTTTVGTTTGTAMGTTTVGTTTMGTNNDLQYLTAMVTGHQQVLSQLPTDVSTVQDPALRQLVTDTRTTVQAHLDEALRLKARLAVPTP